MNRRQLLLNSVVAALVVVGIAMGVTMPGEAWAQTKPKIVVFTKNVTNPFWKSVRVGADKAGKDLGVDIEHAAPTKPDNIEEQTRLVEDWIVRKPAAFVFVPVDYNALVPSMQKVNKAGIPVVNFNNRIKEVDVVTYIGSDDETIGYEITKYLIKAMGDKGNLVHIDGVPAAITAQNRKKGLERALKEFPNVKLVASQPGNYRRLPAVQVFENLMQSHPVIDGVMCANDDMAVGVAEALAAAGRGDKTKVVGIDAIPDGAAAILAGKMLATADFSGHDQGYLAVTAAVKHLRGEKIPKEIILPVLIVNKDNAKAWTVSVEEKQVPSWDRVIKTQKP
ncbi:MAG TPA: sugar ABC transporter substrate-binding protein [Burkholderiales bacterium]|nr:sugar ABC transporter substrate-binding protein [Burkholderiales bacterium]